MDEVLKRRLAGALVLILVAFVLSLILPRPGEIRSDADGKRVTIDLSPDATLPAPAAAAPTPVPPVIAAVPENHDPANNDTASVAANEDNDPEIEEPPVSTAQARAGERDAAPAAAAPAVLPEKPEPVAAVATAKPAPEKLEAKPALKLADKLSQKPEPKPPASEVKPAVQASAKPPPPAAQKSPEVAAKPSVIAPPKGRWYVQAGAFTDVGNAHQVLDKLTAGGLKGIISPLDSSKGTRYRVRVGPFAQREQAKAAQERVTQLGYANGSLVED
jgi:DedD protein